MPYSGHSSSPYQSFPDIPPFPDNVPTAPLVRISLEKLLRQDTEEQDRCWKACCDLGFCYLDLDSSSRDNVAMDGRTLLKDADRLFEIMKSFFDLDVQEKVKYDFKYQGSYFGYKGYGEGIIDVKGTRDRNEFYNISKDDVLGLSSPLPSPAVLNTHRGLFESYIRSSHAICMLIISLISVRLPLSQQAQANGGLEALHRLDTNSGDQIRFVRAPPQEVDMKGVALGEHTDFGSVTVLFNRLGGLQVKLPPSIGPDPPTSKTPPPSHAEKQLCQDGWTYVRPLPGHCIINLGDALVKFSSNILRSNIHRVVTAPGEQGSVTRYSLVYFCRPGDDVVLKCLVEGGDVGEEEVTARQWILRRAFGRRKEGGWEASQGTEMRDVKRSGGMRV